MMVITHILVGGALASLISTQLVLTGMLGGFLPDLDILKRHRRSLHFPFLYGIGAVAALSSYLITQSDPWAHISVFLGSASLHSFSDAFGGGLEEKPWKETDDRGVYSHFQGRWIETRHWLYDGSPGDFTITLIAGSVLIYREVYVELAAFLVIVAFFYSLFRKKFPEYVPEDPVEALREKL